MILVNTRDSLGVPRRSCEPRGGHEGRLAMRVMACIEDMRRAARRRVPRMFFEYADHGSYAQETLRANRSDLERIKLRQRVLVDVVGRDLSTTILGESAALPMMLAPIGLCGMQWGDGEILACRAAQAAGIPFCLSTMSICAIEDVAAAVGKPFWFQLYVMKDRGFVRALVERAIAAKCSALVLTVDLQVLGQRHCGLVAMSIRFSRLGSGGTVMPLRRSQWRCPSTCRSTVSTSALHLAAMARSTKARTKPRSFIT